MKIVNALSDLTPKQQEVAQLAAAGLQDKEIAYRVGWTEMSTRTLMAAVYRRLAVTNRAQLTAWVLRHGQKPRDRIFESFAELRPAEQLRVIADLSAFCAAQKEGLGL